MKILRPSEAFKIRASYAWVIAALTTFAALCAAGAVDILRDAWEEYQSVVNWVPPAEPFYTMFYAVNGIEPTAPTPDYTLNAAGASLLVLFAALSTRGVVDMYKEMREKLLALA